MDQNHQPFGTFLRRAPEKNHTQAEVRMHSYEFPNSKSAERILYGLIFYVLNENPCEFGPCEQDIPATNNFTQSS
jgi:hypothetical protein